MIENNHFYLKKTNVDGSDHFILKKEHKIRKSHGHANQKNTLDATPYRNRITFNIINYTTTHTLILSHKQLHIRIVTYTYFWQNIHISQLHDISSQSSKSAQLQKLDKYYDSFYSLPKNFFHFSDTEMQFQILNSQSSTMKIHIRLCLKTSELYLHTIEKKRQTIIMYATCLL